ncbi:MAG: HD domain-containing protein [Bacillota bacterium]
MEPLAIIRKYYDPESKAYRLLVGHSEAVAQKALAVAERVAHLGPDRQFIREAALLHDIGIFLTDAPELGCFGEKPYVCHGYLGREILEREGFPRHALVCERHVGVGITRADIEKENLPLPLREMVPVSIEEQIVCFADKFFSKDEGRLGREKSPAEISRALARFGAEKVRRFEEWLRLFGNPPVSLPAGPE